MTDQPKHKYIAPDLELLAYSEAHRKITHVELDRRVKYMQNVLENYGIQGKVLSVNIGHMVSNYKFMPKEGVRIADILAITEDIARAFATDDRIIITRKPYDPEIYISVPNVLHRTLRMGNLIWGDEFPGENYSIPWLVGEDVINCFVPVVYDLTELEHVLIKDGPGISKTNLLQSLIMSVVYTCPPNLCQLVIIDPWGENFKEWNGIPHLAMPVATGKEDGAAALQYVKNEIDKRLEILRRGGNRIDWPYMVVVMDDVSNKLPFSDEGLSYIAHYGAVVDVHMVAAIRDPRAASNYGPFRRAYVPTRMVFRTYTSAESMDMLGVRGAENLQNHDDILVSDGKHPIVRIHTPSIDWDEIKSVAFFLRSGGKDAPQDDTDMYQRAKDLVIRDKKATITHIQRNLNIGRNQAASYLKRMEQEGVVDKMGVYGHGTSYGVRTPRSGDGCSDKSVSVDQDLYQRAKDVVICDNRPTISYIQRTLQIGYHKAAGLLERMEQEGIVSSPNENGKRQLISQTPEMAK